MREGNVLQGRQRSALNGCQLVLALLFATGCSSVGPQMVHRDRFDYGDALVRGWNEQLLLNLVRLRYRDTPVFLNVDSISTNYTRETSGSLAGTLSSDSTVVAGAQVTWKENPTVQYRPITGEDFVEKLLSPIPLETLFLLPQNGWSIERVLRCCVQRLEGVLNAPGAAGPTPHYQPVYRDFHELSEILRELQIARLLRFEIREGEAGPSTSEPTPIAHELEVQLGEAKVTAKTHPTGEDIGAEKGAEGQGNDGKKHFVIRILEPAEVWARNRADQQMLKRRAARYGKLTQRLDQLFGKPPNGEGEYELVLPGQHSPTSAASDAPAPLKILPRSLLGVLFFLSHAVEVPEDHSARVTVTETEYEKEYEKVKREDEDAPKEMKREYLSTTGCDNQPEKSEDDGRFSWDAVTGELFRICHRDAQPGPGEAFVAVPYRARWFYLSDTDLASKSTFALVIQLFSLQAGERRGLAPLPTINVGG